MNICNDSGGTNSLWGISSGLINEVIGIVVTLKLYKFNALRNFVSKSLSLKTWTIQNWDPLPRNIWRVLQRGWILRSLYIKSDPRMISKLQFIFDLNLSNWKSHFNTSVNKPEESKTTLQKTKEIKNLKNSCWYW